MPIGTSSLGLESYLLVNKLDFFSYPFQSIHRFIQQKSCVVHEHIDELDKLFARFWFVDNSDFVHVGFPHGFQNDGNVIADCEFVVKLRWGPGLFHLCKWKKKCQKNSSKKFVKNSRQKNSSNNQGYPQVTPKLQRSTVSIFMSTISVLRSSARPASGRRA